MSKGNPVLIEGTDQPVQYFLPALAITSSSGWRHGRYG
jgi:hypothetical protein